MAGELKLNANFQFDSAVDGIRDVVLNILNLSVDVSEKNFVDRTMATSTAEAALNLGSISALGWIFVINLDDVNVVLLRASTGAANTAKLKPGEFAFYRSATNTPFVIAGAGTPKIRYIAVGD